MVQVLTVAGSDSGGGAGIQADLKTFSALGAYGASVITAITAQNTCAVERVFVLPAEEVEAQYRAVLSDLDIAALKFGMLANAEIIATLADALAWKRPEAVVLDTVMLAKSGDLLLATEAVSQLRDQLLPLADVITPNLPEAAALLGEKIAQTEAEVLAQAKKLQALGAKHVLMKGGHWGGETSPDWLVTPTQTHVFPATRIATQHGHGTGCTLSAAMTALYPRYRDWAATVAAAKRYLTQALREADRLQVGQGIGPVHHFYRWW